MEIVSSENLRILNLRKAGDFCVFKTRASVSDRYGAVRWNFLVPSLTESGRDIWQRACF